IRDRSVTGVQTCAHRIFDEGYEEGQAMPIAIDQAKEWAENEDKEEREHYRKYCKPILRSKEGKRQQNNPERLNEREEVVPHEDRSEERRVGKECIEQLTW